MFNPFLAVFGEMKKKKLLFLSVVSFSILCGVVFVIMVIVLFDYITGYDSIFYAQKNDENDSALPQNVTVV